MSELHLVRLLLACLHHAPSEAHAHLLGAVTLRDFPEVVTIRKEYDHCDPACQPVHDDIHPAV